MIDLSDFRTKTITFQQFIPKEKQGNYLKIHFTVPENICRIDIEYSYEQVVNIIDMALLDEKENHVGSSGSEKKHIYISEWNSTSGYNRTEPNSGEWTIIAGAYQVKESGVYVSYTITYTYKKRCLLKGDTHVHTTASDGRFTAREAAKTAIKYGLDFLFITDHNNYSQNFCLPQQNDIVLLPGMEWTHYEGHAGMLGRQCPIDNVFCFGYKSEKIQEVWELLSKARERGAMVVLNHPFCPQYGWKFGMEQGVYDGIELVNGGTEYSANKKCLLWWHKKLCEGKRIPVLGGSDFHMPDNLHRIGMPMTCLYAFSPSLSDIMNALRGGNGYIATQMNAPRLWAQTGDKILGEEAPLQHTTLIRFEELCRGDLLRLITDQNCEEIYCTQNEHYIELHRMYTNVKFVRFEILRNGCEILISNPIYFGHPDKTSLC